MGQATTPRLKEACQGSTVVTGLQSVRRRRVAHSGLTLGRASPSASRRTRRTRVRRQMGTFTRGSGRRRVLVLFIGSLRVHHLTEILRRRQLERERTRGRDQTRKGRVESPLVVATNSLGLHVQSRRLQLRRVISSTERACHRTHYRM